MREYDLMKALGYEFDPGFTGRGGFWFDPQEWSAVAGMWPSVYMLENDQDYPEHAFGLVASQKLVKRILGRINAAAPSDSGPILIPGGISSDDLIRAALSGQVDMMREYQSFMGKPVVDKETAKVSISTAVVTCGGHCGESGD